MKKSFTIVFLFLFIFSAKLKAQKIDDDNGRPETFSLGPGLGLDYGGIGVNMIVYPQKNVGVFFGGGYALAGFGYNFGLKLRIQKEGSVVDPYFMAMYGYNTAVYYEGGDGNQNILFYGPSLGAGIDLHKRHASLGYWSFSLNVPFRSAEARDWRQHHPGTTFTPVTVSVGYKFIIQ